MARAFELPLTTAKTKQSLSLALSKWPSPIMLIINSRVRSTAYTGESPRPAATITPRPPTACLATLAHQSTFLMSKASDHGWESGDLPGSLGNNSPTRHPAEAASLFAVDMCSKIPWNDTSSSPMLFDYMQLLQVVKKLRCVALPTIIGGTRRSMDSQTPPILPP